MPVENPLSVLVYGPPSAGKTTFGVSAFWDWKQNRKLREGRWLQFGREDNPRLAVPPEMVKRFVAADLSNSWVKDFDDYTIAALKKAKTGEGPEVFVVDGFSEISMLYEASSKSEGFDMWNDWRRMFYSTMQRLSPRDLHAHVVATARVMERKKALHSKSGKVFAEGDPDFVNYDYYPLAQGSARFSLPAYFNYVLYMEPDVAYVPPDLTTKKPVHILHLVRTGDFYVKNVHEDVILEKGGPYQLTNPSFDDVLRVLSGLEGKPRQSS